MTNDLLYRAIRHELGRLLNMVKRGELDHLSEINKKEFMASSLKAAVQEAGPSQ